MKYYAIKFETHVVCAKISPRLEREPPCGLGEGREKGTFRLNLHWGEHLRTTTPYHIQTPRFPKLSMGNEVSTISSNLQMLSNARNVNIADESTLSAVGGSVYNVSIDTVHNLEPALDGGFLIALHD